MWVSGMIPFHGDVVMAYRDSKTGTVYRVGRGQILYPVAVDRAARFEPTNKEHES